MIPTIADVEVDRIAYTDEFKEAFREKLASMAELPDDLEECGAVRCYHCHGDGEILVMLHSKDCNPDLAENDPEFICICPIEKAESCVFCRGSGEMCASEREAYGGVPGPGPRIDKFSNKTVNQILKETATYVVDLPADLDMTKVAYVLRRNKTAEDAAQSLRKKKCLVESRMAVTRMKDQYGAYETFCITKGEQLLGGLVRRYTDEPDIPKLAVLMTRIG